MNREDVLRELELLPVWQLRPTLTNTVSPITVAEKLPAPALDLVPTATQEPDAIFDYFQSENSAWIFVCPGSLIDTASQSMLFDNILIALQIKAKKYTGDLAASGAKVIVAMGEKTAQTLLNSTDSIANLRGKQHVLHNVPLIVTFSAAEILEHLPNKAKTWDDLCTALSLVDA
jgi:uracil-DNA glycosylase